MTEIVRIGLDRLPREACGILLPVPRGTRVQSQVVELPNRSLGNTEYTITPEDIRLELGSWAKRATPEQRDAIAVWHTHPQGNIGPSRGDMRKRIADTAYLVVALDVENRRGIPTWF